MTNQQRSSKRRSFPPYDESSKLSRRDQTLVRVEKLLSEQFIVPLQDEAPFDEEGSVDLVDLDEAVETAQLPPEARPQPRTLSPPKPPPAPGPARAAAPVAEPPEKKSRLSVFSAVLQGAILIFVLAWVFLLGILVGRGHLWQSGLGHDLVVWVEQKAGWSDKAGPEVVLKKKNQPDELIPPPAPDGDTTAPPETEPDGQQAAEEKEEMPVWNWGDWSPEPVEGAPAGQESSSGSGPAANPEAGPAASSEAGPADRGRAAESQAPAAETEEEEWPTAIEEDGLGPATEYRPPGDQDDYADYEAMLEPAEVPNATLAEATPLPPDLAGAPGTGKFAVQVAEAADAAEAQRKVNLLISQGFNAYFYDGGNGRFPVRVGRFPTNQAAGEAKVLLEELGHKGAYVSVLGD